MRLRHATRQRLKRDLYRSQGSLDLFKLRVTLAAGDLLGLNLRRPFNEELECYWWLAICLPRARSLAPDVAADCRGNLEDYQSSPRAPRCFSLLRGLLRGLSATSSIYSADVRMRHDARTSLTCASSPYVLRSARIYLGSIPRTPEGGSTALSTSIIIPLYLPRVPQQ